MHSLTSVPPQLIAIIWCILSWNVKSIIGESSYFSLERLSTDHQCDQDEDCPNDHFCEESPFTNYVPFALFGDSIFRRECRLKKDMTTVCTRDKMCLSGKCEMGRCVECITDKDCPADGMYCGGSVQWALTQVDSFFGFGFGRGVVNFLNPEANVCSYPKDDGEFCLRDLECVSNACDLAHCVDNSTRECYDDAQCQPGQFCAGNDNGLERNRCAAKGAEGRFCTGPTQCASSMCVDKQCQRVAPECLGDDVCAPGHFCHLTFQPGRVPRCVPMMSTGSSCGRDGTNRRCSECRQHAHCDERTEFCGRRGLTRLCQKKKCAGFCSSDSACVSGVCSLFLCQEPPGVTCKDDDKTKSQPISQYFK